MDKRYEAFMLRLWQVDDCQKPVWRTSLECSSTGEHRGFATLDELCSYLRTYIGLLEGEAAADAEQPSPTRAGEAPPIGQT